MNWIKEKTKRGVGMTALLILAGCGSQETLLPQAERDMAEIYREALVDKAAPEGEVLNPQAFCAALELEESLQDCEQKLARQVAATYRRIDSDAAPPELDYLPYTRTTQTELDNLFPRLTNPDVVIYVYPHLATRTRAPIPGYTTVVPLYERIEYRLPGEALLKPPVPSRETPSVDGETP